MMELRIGELARRTGLTVRTLHHWEAFGLLPPPRRSPAGYRLYGPTDLERLLRVVALRQLGLSLQEIRRCLDTPQSSLLAVLDRQIAELDAAISRQRRLRDRLRVVADRVRSTGTVSAEAVMEALEELAKFEKHFTREQLDDLAVRREQLGEARIKEVEAEWPRLIAAVRTEMERGTDPGAHRVVELAQRWKELVEMFTGGDEGLTRGLSELLREEPGAREQTGLDAEIIAYVASAWRHAQKR